MGNEVRVIGTLLHTKEMFATILVAMMLATVFSVVVPTNASAEFTGNVTILANGDVDPAIAPISVVGNTYTMTGNILGQITIRRPGITFDGNGKSVIGSGATYGIGVVGVSNVIIQNHDVTGFHWAVMLSSAHDCTVRWNTIHGSSRDIHLYYSDGTTIIGNSLEGDGAGIGGIGHMINTIITGNSITVSGGGIDLRDADGSILSQNSISTNTGITISYSFDVLISANTISTSSTGIQFYHNELFSASGNTINSMGAGIMVFGGGFSKGIITDNSISADSYYGIFFTSSPGTSVKNNNINAYYGIKFDYSDTTKVEDNQISGPPGSSYGIFAHLSDTCIISGNTVSGAGSGIISNSKDNIITGNTATLNGAGIQLDSAVSNIVSDNILSDNSYTGIQIVHGSNQNTVNGNIITGSGTSGIGMGTSNQNNIFGNTISNNYRGIQLSQSSNNNIHENVIHDNVNVGILLQVQTEENIFSNNNLDNNENGFALVHAGDNNVISGNTISDSISDGIRQHSTSHITISENSISNSGSNGINIWHIGNDHNIVDGNTISNSGENGIYLTGSSNSVYENTISYNTNAGLYLYTTDCSITDNSIFNNNFGVFSENGASSTIEGNTISSSLSTGIYILYSSANTIFHNNLIDNSENGFANNPSLNDWHDPVSLEGNYWSDYPGWDDGSGTGKHAIAGDGIGDTELFHPDENYDYYPFTRESGWLNQPPIVDIGQLQYLGTIGRPLQFDASGSTDPNGDILEYRWDFDGDGTWDTAWSTDPIASYTWEEEHTGTVFVEVTDGEFTITDNAAVTIFTFPWLPPLGNQDTFQAGRTIPIKFSYSK